MTARMTRTSIEVLTEKLESWYSQPAGEEEIDPFAYWFLQVYGIPKQVYLQEMERDNKPTNALARLLFKLMKSTSDCQKEGCVRKARRNTLTGEMRRPWFVHSRPATCVWISAAGAPGADACCCAESADPMWRTAILAGILIVVEIGIRRHDAVNQNTEALPQNLLGPYRRRRPPPADSLLKPRMR